VEAEGCEGQEQAAWGKAFWRETMFIHFALWLLEACWRICSQTAKQTEEKDVHVNGSKCLLMAFWFFFSLMKCVDFAFAAHQG